MSIKTKTKQAILSAILTVLQWADRAGDKFRGAVIKAIEADKQGLFNAMTDEADEIVQQAQSKTDVLGRLYNQSLREQDEAVSKAHAIRMAAVLKCK